MELPGIDLFVGTADGRPIRIFTFNNGFPFIKLIKVGNQWKAVSTSYTPNYVEGLICTVDGSPKKQSNTIRIKKLRDRSVSGTLV